MKSLVDFIVVTKNQLPYTKQCVESLFQCVSEHFHLILVDNGSTDETRAYFKNIELQKNPRQEISLILNDENMGYAGGLNQGLEKAKSRYVFFCNNDILFYPGTVTEMIRIAETKPTFGLINPNSNEFGLKTHDELYLNSQKGKWVERCHTSGFCVIDRKSTRLNSSHLKLSRMPSSA